MLKHRTVSDLMTHAVVSVRAQTPFKEVVKILADNDITAVPVVDDADRTLGVVSEADLLHRESTQPDPAGLLAVLDAPGDVSMRPAATTAEGLMTSPAVVAHPEWTVVQAARVMDDGHVKRLPWWTTAVDSPASSAVRTCCGWATKAGIFRACVSISCWTSCKGSSTPHAEPRAGCTVSSMLS